MSLRVDFVIAGVQKAASTTLYELLRQHPRIDMPEVKEAQFFTQERFYRQGHDFLLVYRRGGPETLFGLADVQIMYFADAAPRLAEHNPGVRAFVVVRNPVDRAHSAYWFTHWRGVDPAPTFEAALARENSLATADHHQRAALTYRAHGHYAEQIARLWEAIGRDQVMVLRYEDVVRDPRRVARRAFEWLGVTPEVPVVTEVMTNPTGRSRIPWIERMLLRSGHPGMLRLLIPLRVRYWLRRRVIRPLVKGTIRPERYPAMDPATRAALVAYYRPLNARLGEMLGTDFSDWDR